MDDIEILIIAQNGLDTAKQALTHKEGHYSEEELISMFNEVSAALCTVEDSLRNKYKKIQNIDDFLKE